jgi:Fe-S cluster assembly protein SufD
MTMSRAPKSTRKPTDAETALAQLFAARPVEARATIAGLRAAAFETFSTKGLPGRQDEAWKYTDLRSVLRDIKPLASPADPATRESARTAGLLKGLASRRLVFAGGCFAPELSDLADIEPGLDIRSLSTALADGDPLVTSYLGKTAPVDDAAYALNTAFMEDGCVLRLHAGTTIEKPLELVFVGGPAPATYFLRSLIVLERGAQATIIESYEGPQECDYHVNTATEIVLAENARLDRVKITREGSQAKHITTVVATLAADARLNDFALTVGGALVRDQAFVQMKGRGAAMSTSAAAILRGSEHADTTLVLDHLTERSESRALFKSVLDDNAQSVFQGKVVVHPDAQKTEARMMARALLLSETAQANSKPELEIFADDVQCAHGSTVGALDADLKFYLMARGIPEADAEALLTEAFVGETLDGLKNQKIRECVSDIISARLRKRA